MGKCKDCVWAAFAANADGSRSWDGNCMFYVVQSNGEIRRRHSISQHFECSNGKFRKR